MRSARAITKSSSSRFSKRELARGSGPPPRSRPRPARAAARAPGVPPVARRGSRAARSSLPADVLAVAVPVGRPARAAPRGARVRSALGLANGPSSQSSSSQRSASRICSTSRPWSARGRCPRGAGRAVAGRPARQQPVVECRPRAADVEEAGRARREPDAHAACRSARPDANRRPRLDGGRPRERARARRERRLRDDPDLQPEPAHVAAHELHGRRLRGLPRAARGGAGRVGLHPRRLPDQRRERRREVRRKSLASLTHALRWATRSAPAAWSSTPAGGKGRRATRRSSAPGKAFGEALAETRALPAAVREHRRRRAHDRPHVRGAGAS